MAKDRAVAGVRRMPVRIETIDLEGAWAGWTITAQVNPSLSVIQDLRSEDWDRQRAAIAHVVRAWNFVDEDGEDLGPPDVDQLGVLPIDCMVALLAAYARRINDLTTVPKL